MKFERIPDIADPDFRPVTPNPHPRLQLVPLAEDFVAAFFDTPDADAVATSQLAAWSGDEALCLPLLGTRLARADGGLRYVFFLARPSRELCRRGLWIARGDRPLAEIDPTALQSPVVDALALLVGLAPDGERRLLRALLTTGQSLFGDRAFTGIRDIVTQLLERLAPPPLPLRAWCPVGRKAAVASYTLPRDLDPGALGMPGARRSDPSAARIFDTLVSVGPGGARRLAGVEADVEIRGDDRLLHVFLPGGAAPDSTLVALSDTPLRLAGPTADQRQRPLGPWLLKRTPPVRRQMRRRLDGLAVGDASARALLAEISCPETARPEVVPHLVTACAAGLFFIASVRDPHRLLSKLLLRTPEGDRLLPLARPLHHPRLGPVQVGFVPQAPGDAFACAPGDTAELFALYRSGRTTRIADVTLEPMPQDLPGLLEDLPAGEVAPVLAAALAGALGERPPVAAELIEVAPGHDASCLILVVELDASLDYPFALAAALAGRRDVTLVLHHPDRRILPALRALGEELNAVHGIGVALVAFASDDVLPAERVRAAIGCAPAGPVIVLAGDALPANGPWLEGWLSVLSQPGPVLAGPAVTDHDLAGSDTGTGAVETDMPLPDARACGLNDAARAVFAELPLRMATRAGDLAQLARYLRRSGGEAGGAAGGAAGGQVLREAHNPMIAHARAPQRPAALVLAECLTLEGIATA